MKHFLLVVAVLFSAFIYGQEWTSFELPTQSASALCVSYPGGFITVLSGDGQYYESSMPQPGQPPIWQRQTLPVNAPVKDAGSFSNYLFVLYDNGDLWQRSDGGEWTLAFSNVVCIHQSNGKLLAYQDGILLSFNDGWTFCPTVPNIKAIAANDDNILMFANTNSDKTVVYQSPGLYDGFSVWTNFDMPTEEACLSNDEHPEYLAVSKGNLITWYQTDINLSFRWVNFLGPGVAHSATVNQDSQYFVVGEVQSVLGTVGFITNTKDITSIRFTGQPMLKVRSGQEITAAISQSEIYLLWGNPALSLTPIHYKEEIFSVINIGNIFRIEAKEASDLQIYDMAGKLVYQNHLSSGQHDIILNLPSGAYFVGGQLIVRP